MYSAHIDSQSFLKILYITACKGGKVLFYGCENIMLMIY